MHASWAAFFGWVAGSRASRRALAAGLGALLTVAALAASVAPDLYAAPLQNDPFNTGAPAADPKAEKKDEKKEEPKPAPKPAAGKPAAGPRYAILTVAQPTAAQTRAVSGALSAESLNAEAIDPVLDYKLSQLTLPGDMASYAAVREELKYRWLVRATAPKVHDHLVTRIFDTCKQLAGTKYHPYTRINAVLLIGELNKIEAQSKDGGIPPERYHDALPALLDLIEAKDSVEGVVVAALVGVDRHTRYFGDGKTDEKVVDRTYALLSQVAADANANVYMRRLAVRALGHSGLVGTKSNPLATVELLTKVVNDPANDLILRSEAGRSLGILDLRKANVPNPETLAKAVVTVVVETAKKSGGQEKKWPGAKFLELQRAVSYGETSFNGRDAKAHQREMDGLMTVDAEGIMRAAAKAKPDQVIQVTNLKGDLEAFANVLFSSKAPTDDDIAAALDILESHLANVPDADAPAGAAANTSAAAPATNPTR